MDLAQTTIVGTLAGPPVRSVAGKNTVTAEFSLAVVRRWTGPHGQLCDRTEYVTCRAIGRAANSICKYGAPGVEIVVVGGLRQQTEPDGTARLYVEADCVGYLSPRDVREAFGQAW
jgi:single-stranded DNA-binding protein